MTIQTLTLSQIQPCAMNPRKFFNDATIEELAQSIKTDGLLQNLVVLKPTGRAKKHTIIAGERRFRAISHLIEKGELDKDFPVRVEIKEGLSNDEALRIATVENVHAHAGECNRSRTWRRNRGCPGKTGAEGGNK